MSPLRIIKAAIRYLKDEDYRFLMQCYFHWHDDMSDEEYISRKYKAIFKREIDLNNPQSFNEKLNWMKINDHNPLYTQLVDKYLVKGYVDQILGPGFTFPTLAVYNSFDDIDFNQLPDSFVLKCTHDSGGVVLVKDKKKFKKKKAARIMNKHLGINYYLQEREWPYKNVLPRIIVEEYQSQMDGEGLKDYKFFCFNGRPEFMYVATDRNVPKTEVKFDYFDMNFNHLPFECGHKNSDKEITKPDNFDYMVEIASKLSAGFPQVRVDLYDIDGRVYFGEMTFFHMSGFYKFEPDEWDYKLGEYFVLPGLK